MAQVVDPAQQAQDPDFKPQYHKKKKKGKKSWVPMTSRTPSDDYLKDFVCPVRFGILARMT
jgi:hypothetical protein